MRPRSLVTSILGIILALLGIVSLIKGGSAHAVIPVIVGGALAYLGWRGGRIGLIVFGHACIVLGCYLITWGMYLLPYSKPILAHILTRPLFWGLFSLMGGICANYHGFCQCIRMQK